MELTKASIIKRFIAFFIDWYLSSLLAGIPVVIMQSIQAKDLIILNRLDDLTLTNAWIGGLLALTVYTLYYCFLPCKEGSNRKLGQTFGRQLMKIQLVKTDGSALTFTNLLIRDILGVLLLEGYLTSANIYIMSLIQMTTNSYVVPYFQAFYYATVTISLVLYFIRKKKQMLHDIISRTRMVESEKSVTTTI
ncbi:MAG: RDD family protein [Mobilitalea sp.]